MLPTGSRENLSNPSGLRSLLPGLYLMLYIANETVTDSHGPSTYPAIVFSPSICLGELVFSCPVDWKCQGPRGRSFKELHGKTPEIANPGPVIYHWCITSEDLSMDLGPRFIGFKSQECAVAKHEPALDFPLKTT